MRTLTATISAAILAAIVATPGYAGELVTANDAFDRLKALDGAWQSERESGGEADSHEPEPPARTDHHFAITGAGSVVVETMFPGTPHEMVNMIHLDGEDLLLTHYCAAGNQPQMRLNRERSTRDHLIFDFVGGTNLDPGKDHHIHNTEIFFDGDNRLRSDWTGYSNGEPVGVTTFRITRVE